MTDVTRYCRKGRDNAREWAEEADEETAARLEARAEAFEEVLKLLEGSA